MRRWYFRPALAALVAWLLTTLGTLFDASTRSEAPFRVGVMGHARAILDYTFVGCAGGNPPALGVLERVDLRYHQMMAWIDLTIADCKGEPEINFEWVVNRAIERARQRRASRTVAEGMSHRGFR